MRFDAYRDHHLHKYDELHSFEEVYHRHVLLALPSTPVLRSCGLLIGNSEQTLISTIRSRNENM